MQVGKPQVPLRMNFDPLSGSALAQTPQRLLNRSLTATMSRLAFQHEQQAFSHAARGQISGKGRGFLLDELHQRLSSLQGSLELPSLIETTTRVVSPASGSETARGSALASGSALNLGTATSVSGSSGSGGGASVLDPDAALADQPLATAVTAGTLNFSVTLGGFTQNLAVAVDPTADSLNDVLGRISSRTGANVYYDQTAGQIHYEATVKASDFSLQVTGGSSNFYDALAGAGQTRTVTATGGQAVGAVSGETTFNDLTIGYLGQTYEISGLSVTNKQKSDSATDKAAAIATQINTQLAAQGAGLTATATNGVLSFTATDTTDPASTATQLSFTETAPAASGGKKGGKKGGGGTTTAQSLGLDDGNTAVSVQLVTQPKLAAASSGSGGSGGALLGPDATLADLAGQLGLTAQNGEYAFSINGTRLAFDESATLNDVLAGINRSQAGVTASYDAQSQRVVVTANQPGAGPVLTDDLAGNLLGGLGLTLDRASFGAGASTRTPEVTETVTQLSEPGAEALRRFGEKVGEVIGLLEAAAGDDGAFKNDPLLTDLRDALGGLFKPGDGQSFQSLADLGFKLDDGQVSFDVGALRSLSSEKLGQADAFLGRFLTGKAGPLLRTSGHAVEDAQALAPLEKRLAEQAVAAHAEISRLQQRQQLLLFQQVTLDRQKDSLKRQDDVLKSTQDRLNPSANEDRQQQQALPTGLPETPEAPAAPVPAVASSATAPSPPIAPVLGSFGLSD